jgi:hypothetical protein
MKHITALLAAAWVATAVSVIAANETFKVSELTFKRPSSWEWVETTSSMRAAQLKVGSGKTAADSAEVVFFHFGPGGAGGTQANVDRWLAQFSDRKNDKTEETTVGKTKVTYVRTEGTYQSGMPMGPKTPLANQALLGAIIEAPGGSIFVKMTGPLAIVKAADGEFRAMVEGPLK